MKVGNLMYRRIELIMKKYLLTQKLFHVYGYHPLIKQAHVHQRSICKNELEPVAYTPGTATND
jgi:hypothetical protein